MKKKFFWFCGVILLCLLVFYGCNRHTRDAIPSSPNHVGQVWMYPDSNLTPGAVMSGVTAEDICRHGYTKEVRDVPVSLKREVCRRYNVSYPTPHGAYEIDHFIPLELGGSNEVTNLWPEPADPHPGFHEKDVVENYLHHEVCKGRMTLQEAQEAIWRDWYAVYLKIKDKK